MSLIDLLTASDVEILFGDNNGHITDLGAGNVVDRLEVSGGGQTQVLRPIRSSDPIITATQTTWAANSDLYDSPETDALSSVDTGRGTLAVLLTRSDRGWLIPADMIDEPEDDASRRYDVSDIVRVSAMWDTVDAVRVVMDVVPVTANGNANVVVPDGGEVWAVLKTAGSVGGVNLGIGIHRLAGNQPQQAIVGARGWLCGAIRRSA